MKSNIYKISTILALRRYHRSHFHPLDTDTGGQRYIYEASALLTKTELATVIKSLLATLHHEPDYKVTIPELLLHGSDDNLGNIRKIMPKWHARDPHSEFVIIPEASHCTNIDNPAFFNRTALDWLGRTLP